MPKAICSELPANSGKGVADSYTSEGGAQSTSPTEQRRAGLRRAVTRHPHQSESRPLSSSERSQIIAKAHSGHLRITSEPWPDPWPESTND